MAESPSQVDFYVGNTLVLRRQVAPGPFDIRNFSFYGGARDVRVVIRDALGREQTIAHPFYFATQGLSQGLHDYAYQLGAVRDDLEGTDGAYGKAAYSAFHQYGFTDALTLGLRSEGTRHAQNAGFDAYYRNEALGLVSLHGGVSRDTERGNGSAVRISYAFLRNDFNTYLVLQRFSADYAVLHGEFTPRLPKQDLSANIGYTTRFGSFGVGLTRLQLHGEPVHRTGLVSWTLPISSHLSINTYARREWGERRDTQYFVGLQYNPSIDLNASLTHQHDTAGSRTTTMQLSSLVPRGEGVAWALGAQRQESAEGQSVLVTPRVQWNARYATLTAEASHLRGGPAGDTTAYTAAVDGSFVATGGRFAMTRAIPDAFAIVETAPPMAGIRVYENSQEIGRTDASGRILLTNITSYATSQASIEDKDVPIEYSIDKVHRTFSVPTRSGRVVTFPIIRVRAFTGHFRYRAGSRVLPLEFVMVTVTAGGRKFEAPTGVAGEFYIENLPPGRAHGLTEVDGNPCEFTFEVPESDDNLVSLGNITGCDAQR